MSSDLHTDPSGHVWLNYGPDRRDTDRCQTCRQTWVEVTSDVNAPVPADCPGAGPRVIEPLDPLSVDVFRDQIGLSPFGKFKDLTGLDPSGPAEPLPRRISIKQMSQNLANAVRESRRRKLLAKRLDGQPFPAFEPPSYPHDCGLDLKLAEDVVIRRGGTANVPTGVAIALPPDTFGWVTGRSSTWARHGLIVMSGILDETWRGELRVLMFRPMTIDATQPEDLHLPAGTRVAQLIVLPNLLEGLEITTLPQGLELPKGERDQAGFGSSGS